MKKQTRSTSGLTNDSQKRLLAYTTAASLGAFFVTGQEVRAQVTLSGALAPYPHIFSPYNYPNLDIDGDGNNDFHLAVAGGNVIISAASGAGILNPSSNPYVIPWTVGSTIDGSASTAPATHYGGASLASVYGLETEPLNNFSTEGALGFEFVSSLDGETHFGYMDIQITDSGSYPHFTATVDDIYWNATPNTGITVQAVPEPSSLALLAAGISGLAIRRFRRQRAV
jgi:PEP-CTERM motif